MLERNIFENKTIKKNFERAKRMQKAYEFTACDRLIYEHFFINGYNTKNEIASRYKILTKDA